jgi:uncharacterized protein DUF4382
MRRATRLFLPALLSAALTLTACTDSSGPAGGQPRVTVRLTDAAGDFKAAVVTISEIDLVGGSGGKVVLMSTPVTTDLLDLANSTATLVDAAVVPPGTYSELRFVITGGYVAIDDGAGGSTIFATSASYAGLPAGAQVAGELKMPSLGQSGLKVNFAGGADLDIGADQDFLVDFNVAQSFGHEAGNSGMWVMHPVITGATATEAGTVVATLKLGTGVTLPVPPGGAVTLAAFKADLDGERVAFTDPDGDGTFEARFRFLLPGTHTLTIVAPAGLTVITTPVGPVSLGLVAGATSTEAFTITAASLTP